MDNRIELNPNEVVAFLGKLPGEFTRADMLRFIREKGIRMIDFMYPAEDGRVKTLNFTVNNLAYAETILTEGERVDGSSLFPSFIEAGNSDLYVLPRYRTAFVDPFNEIPTLCFLCSFFDKNGEPFDCAPYQTLMRAEDAFYQSTGMTFEAMGELEYYVITDADPLFPATDQKGYHESEPFAKLNDFRRACMVRVAQTGGQIKYGHSEVGNFTLDGKIYEQNEIEFLPNPVATAADQLLLAKWVIRNLAYQWGLDVSFAPKITTGKAGSGMHIHMRLMKDGSVRYDNFVEAKKLFNYGFDNFAYAKVAVAGIDPMEKASVKYAKDKRGVVLVPATDVNCLLPKEYDKDKVGTHYELNDPKGLEAPLEAGEKVGTLFVTYDNVISAPLSCKRSRRSKSSPWIGPLPTLPARIRPRKRRPSCKSWLATGMSRFW